MWYTSLEKAKGKNKKEMVLEGLYIWTRWDDYETN